MGILNLKQKTQQTPINRQDVINNIAVNLEKKLSDIQLKKLELLLTEHPIKLSAVLYQLDKQIKF